MDSSRQQKLEQQQRTGGGKDDKVVLSEDARLASDAIKAASKAPEVRQDVVERARARLESGELGKDLNRLADKIIDNLLSR